ncbi:MAG: hypothetical protein Q7T30_00235 [Planctomycetota bacterium]|nr:hypothetical protein [Planctomycetota bacterium]
MPTFLTDECLARSVHKSLVDAGEAVESMIDRYGRGAKEPVWLPDAGKHRLIVISKDDAIRKKPAELALLIQHRVLFFAFTPEHVFTAPQQGETILKALPHIKRMVQLQSARDGIVARIHPDGHVTRRPRD